jgi:glucose-6-phosphate-specific signal transduction histidine kinase
MQTLATELLLEVLLLTSLQLVSRYWNSFFWQTIIEMLRLFTLTSLPDAISLHSERLMEGAESWKTYCMPVVLQSKPTVFGLFLFQGGPRRIEDPRR